MSDSQNPYGRAYQPTQSYPTQSGPPYPGPPYAGQPTGGQPYPGQPYAETQTHQPGQYAYAPPQQYPPYGGGPQGSPYGPGPTQPPRNGFGITALVLSIVGLALAFVPFTGFVAVILGGLAVLFGLLGLGRVRRGEATNKVMPIIGTVLGGIAIVVGVIATVLVVSAAVRLAADQSRNTTPTTSPPTPSVPSTSPVVPSGQTGPAPGTFNWDDGLSVEVSAPREVTFSDTACCATSGRGVAFTIRLINNTGKIVAPYAVQTSLTLDGVDAEQVFDIAKGFDAPSNSIPVGRDLTVDVAFDGTGSDLVLEIGGYPYDSALFTATL